MAFQGFSLPVSCDPEDEASLSDDTRATANFYRRALSHHLGEGGLKAARILDFGCGTGELVWALRAEGLDVHGCDVQEYWPSTEAAKRRLRTIAMDPYTLPFEGDSFDAVMSTSVLEHAQNKEACFREIRRVLKPGGYAVHCFPAKHYLPLECHIRVPLVNFFWPAIPKWWLALWALLGIRSDSQRELGWREVVQRNHRYCRNGLSYWPTGRYIRLSTEVFGNAAFPMDVFIRFADGGFARLARKFRCQTLGGWLSREFRTAYLVSRK